jgi:predicted nucleic acid-binding protein
MDKVRLYLDNCCYNRPFDDQEQVIIWLESAAKMVIQSKVTHGEIALVWSFMLDYENSQNTDFEKRNKIFEWAKYAETYFIGTDKTDRIANELILKGIKNKDAVHLACAIESGCDYFVTTDKSIIKKKNLITELQIINPLEYFIKIGETYEKR